jgi:parallel beta-helix repeat protein
LAIQWVGRDIVCLSTDTKPTLVPVNTKAFETNTGVTYRFNGTAWIVEAGGGGGGGGFSAGGAIFKSGTGSQTVFTIAHGLTSTPDVYFALPTNAAARGDISYSVDATNITLTYPVAPASGTNNLSYVWGAGYTNVALSGFTAASVTTLTNKTISELSNTVAITQGPKYTVFKSGSTYYARNGNTGAIDSSNSSATIVIQYALDNLTAGRNYRETVKLKGDFTISKITIPSFTTLDLIDARLFQANGTNTLMIENADTTNGNTDIQFIGGLIDGNRVNQTGGGTADGHSLARFVNCSNISVHNGKWIHANYHCLFFKNCYTGCIVSNNRFENWKQEGVHFTAADLASNISSGHVVANNYFIHHRNDPEESAYATTVGSCAIVTINVNDFVCNANTVKNTMAGSSVTFNGLRNIITNNVVVDGAGGTGVIGTGTTSAGIVLSQGVDVDYDSSNSIIANNIVKNMGKIGIHVQSAYASKNIIVANNYVERCGEPAGTSTGILVSDADSCIITGNLVRDCFGSGIRLSGSTLHSTVNGIISNNICWNNGQGLSANDIFRDGIGVDGATGATVSNVTVIGNRCYDTQGTKTQKYGIRLLNTIGCIVKDNDIRDNLTAGFAKVTDTGSVVRYNEGYATEAEGATSIADGGTITHGLVTTPVVAIVTARTAGEFASVTARSTTTITVAIKKHDNTPGTTQIIDWRASI